MQTRGYPTHVALYARASNQRDVLILRRCLTTFDNQSIMRNEQAKQIRWCLSTAPRRRTLPSRLQEDRPVGRSFARQSQRNELGAVTLRDRFQRAPSARTPVPLGWPSSVLLAASANLDLRSILSRWVQATHLINGLQTAKKKAAA